MHINIHICVLQAALVRPVGKIRQNTAARTDERVRLASEAIQGSLAMKMLSWEVRGTTGGGTGQAGGGLRKLTCQQRSAGKWSCRWP